MAVDRIHIMLRASIGRTILEVVPGTHPSWREANIQAEKLIRLLREFNNKFPEEALGDGSKGLRKRMGAEARALDQQAKLAQRLLLKTLEEDFFAKHPTSHTRKDLRWLFAWMGRALEQKLYHDAQEIRRKLPTCSREQLRLHGPFGLLDEVQREMQREGAA